MNTEITGIVVAFAASVLLAVPLGRYIARVYANAPTWLDRVFGPIEKIFYKLIGERALADMDWKNNMVAMLTVNLVWFGWGMFVLLNQSWLPWNPDRNPNMSADLAFNTAISFLVNCNLQHYAGETGASYFSQIFCFMFLHFTSAATGMAALVLVFNGLKARTASKLGNFYVYFIKANTRILLPLSVVVAVLLAVNGTPMTGAGKATVVTLQGDTMKVSRGPAAALIAIKHLGTNGGGFFGANSAHPLENPNYLTNLIEVVAQTVIPMALIFALGFYLNRKKLAWMIFGVMTVGFLLLVIPTVYYEVGGNPAIARMGVDMQGGAMEGKEVRFGSAASAYWSIITTVISTGSVNSMHDSFMPLSGLTQLLGMMVNCFYGGCGVGILNFYLFIIIAVFISGLMVGRTPEFMGKKIEAREMKIAMVIALLHPLLILAGTALASFEYSPVVTAGWLNNQGFHGFSEMFYEFTSAAANNGSGFEGLGDNNPFWNLATGVVLILSRFLPIIGPVAIAGILAEKKFVPESAGTLKTDTATFGVMIFAVIVILALLSFFPALALGPIAEYFSLY